MKINFNGYEIEIKAKFKSEERMNKYATLCFLNELAIVYGESQIRNEMLGCNAIASEYEKKRNILFDTCYQAGLYD